MKRKTLKLVACAAAMSLTLSVTACGGSDNSSANTAGASETANVEKEEAAKPEAEVEAEVKVEVETAEEAAKEAEAEVEEAADASEDYQTLEDYFNDPSLKSIYDSMIEAMSEDDLAISYEVSGNDFIMIFQITDSSLIVDGLAEGLAAALDEQADQFKEQAAEFDEALGEEGACTVTVRYTDPDGGVLAEQTFSAD